MQRGSRGSVLLIELLIVILFFSVSASIDLQLFGEAHARQEKSRALTRAVAECQDWAEAIYASDDPAQTLKSEGWTEQSDKSMSHSGDGLELLAKWNIEQTEAGTLLAGSVEARKDGETLFAIPVARYRSAGGDEG